MFYSGEQYLDSLYSQHHVQTGTEELLLPLNTQQQVTAYPTALYQNQISGGMVTHLPTQNFDYQQQQSTPRNNIQHYGKLKGFDPNNYMTGFVNKNYAQQQQQLENKPRARSSVPSTPKVLSNLSPTGHNIYEATYSGVNVYELILEANSIMRRRDDSWVNATHILKVLCS